MFRQRAFNVYLELCKRSSICKSILPFTDWQNDLHLIVGIGHAIPLCSRIDLAKLIAAATR